MNSVKLLDNYVLVLNIDYDIAEQVRSVQIISIYAALQDICRELYDE